MLNNSGHPGGRNNAVGEVGIGHAPRGGGQAAIIDSAPGWSRDRQFVDVSVQRTRVDWIATDVVEPDAPARVME